MGPAAIGFYDRCEEIKRAPVSRCLNRLPCGGAGPDAKHLGLKGFILL